MLFGRTVIRGTVGIAVAIVGIFVDVAVAIVDVAVAFEICVVGTLGNGAMRRQRKDAIGGIGNF